MADDEIAPPLQGPWPDGRSLLRREVDAYLGDVADGTLDDLPTRCEPWTVADVTTHLAETFLRFDRMIERGRHGDFAPPFGMDELDAENQRAIDAFSGDPVRALAEQTDALLAAATDLDEPLPHQVGTIPVGLQLLFGLMDVAVHHDDVLAAAGRRYPLPADVVAALLPVAQRLFGMPPDVDDAADALIQGTGRPAY